MSRRVSINDHQRWRECLHGEPEQTHADDLDPPAIVDHPPAQRSKRETNRVLRILDELDKGGRTA